MWMDADYGLDVGGRPEALGVLWGLDSIYPQGVCLRGFQRKKLMGGLHAYIQTQKNRGVNHQINDICA
ncbi:MAG: hypothetical protein KAU03_00045 [Candidatus Altiarchaeales archaeon]|nr:hypothetical protein [Candidatus Altiarchaeales archaeon]